MSARGLRRAAALAVISLGTSGSSAFGAPLEVSGTLGNLSATARFEAIGNSLRVTFTNTSAMDVLVPGEVLTSLFFDVDSPTPLGLMRQSATIGAGSEVLFGTTDPGGGVGGEWAYSESLRHAPGGGSYGLSAAGLGLFGPRQRFPGSNLEAEESVGGIEYGLTSAGDNSATGNHPVTGANALIRNRVVFSLGGLLSGFDPSTQINSVFFQYGTSVSETGFPGVPESPTLALILIGSAAVRRRG